MKVLWLLFCCFAVYELNFGLFGSLALTKVRPRGRGCRCYEEVEPAVHVGLLLAAAVALSKFVPDLGGQEGRND